ncbi:MAG: hypothetical protein ABR915_09495 [Thermoguttaceae bacterium]|jgi:hypothetical protein
MNRFVVPKMFLAWALLPVTCWAGDPKTKQPEARPGEEWKLTEQRGENPIRASSQWKDVVGHRVAVEGIVWGSGKGLDPYVVLHGGVVFLDESALSLPQFGVDNNGRILRVVGTLTLLHIKKSPPDVQGYGYDFDAFIVKPEKIKILDRATWPWMEDLGKPVKGR